MGTLVYYKSWFHWVPRCRRPCAGVVSSHSSLYPGDRVKHITQEPISWFRWLKNCSCGLLTPCGVSLPGDTKQNPAKTGAWWKGTVSAAECTWAGVSKFFWSQEKDRGKAHCCAVRGLHLSNKSNGWECKAWGSTWSRKFVSKSVQLQVPLWKIRLLCLSFFH